MDWNTIIGVVASALVSSGGTGALIKYLDHRRATRQDEHQFELTEEQQARGYSRQVFEDLRKEVAEMKVEVSKCRSEHADALSRYAETKYEMGKLHGAMNVMQSEMNHMRAATTRQVAEGVRAQATIGAEVVKAAADAMKKSDSGIMRGEVIDEQNPLPVRVIE